MSKYLSETEKKLLKYLTCLNDDEKDKLLSQLTDEQPTYLNDLMNKYEDYKLYLLDRIDEARLPIDDANKSITQRHANFYIKTLRFNAETLENEAFENFYNGLSELEQKYVDKILENKERKKAMLEIVEKIVEIEE